MWKLDKKVGWELKNWCFWIVVLEKTLESPLDSKELKLVNTKGNQPWIFPESTDAKAEAPIFWPPDVKSQLIGKDPDDGKNWGQERRGWITEEEMVGCRSYSDSIDMSLSKLWETVKGREARSPWGHKESDTT